MITTDKGRFERGKGIKVDKFHESWLCHDPKKTTGYMVCFENGTYHCECGDKYKANWISCKHIVAVALFEKVKIKVLGKLKK